MQMPTSGWRRSLRVRASSTSDVATADWSTAWPSLASTWPEWIRPHLLTSAWSRCVFEDAQLLGKFDAVAAVMALHHADLDAVVRALANLLRPRGSVFIYEFSWDAYDGRAAAWLAKHDLSPADNSVAGWRREHSELHTTATIKTPTAGSGEGYPHFHPHPGCRKPNPADPGLDGQRLHVWAVSAGRRLFLGARLRVYDRGADLRVLIVSRRSGSAASGRTRPGFGCLEGGLLLAERTKAGG